MLTTYCASAGCNTLRRVWRVMKRTTHESVRGAEFVSAELVCRHTKQFVITTRQIDAHLAATGGLG